MEPNMPLLPPVEVKPVKKVESPMFIKLRQNFPFLAIAALFIGFLADFCFYNIFDNFSGTVYPLFVLGVLITLVIVLRRLELVIKRKSWKLLGMSLLFAIATWRTDSAFLHFYNTIAIFILAVLFLIQQFYQEENWGMGKYITNVIVVPFASIGAWGMPFQHGNSFFKEGKAVKSKQVPAVLTGLALSIPILIVLLSLLGQADMIFKEALDTVFSFSIIFKTIRHLCLIVVGFLGFYGLIAAFCKHDMNYQEHLRDKKEPMTMIVVSLMILLCYLMFCWIQVRYLFGNNGGNLPAGITYSEYARQGFFQLLAVVLINWFYVLVCLHLCRDNKFLKGLLIGISGCTFIMISSALYRMILYVDVYHLTFLRVLVLWFLILVTPLMGGAVCYVLKRNFPLLRFSVAVIMTGYLCFSLIRPDAVIASYNVARIEVMSRQDVNYLLSLSADGYPFLLEISEAQAGASYDWIREWIELEMERHGDGFKEFNFSRNKVKVLLQKGRY